VQQLEIVPGTDGDEPEDKGASGSLFRDVIEARWRRRDLLAGGLATALGALFGLEIPSPAAAQTKAVGKLGFVPVPVGETDAIVVPPGYRTQVLLPWGTPTLGHQPAFAVSNSGADQALQIGSHHDGMHYFAIDGSSEDGLLVINHEYVEPRLMHASAAGQKLSLSSYTLANGKRLADEVLKEINAHGVSITRIRRGSDGRWASVSDTRNRRITGLTPMEIRGPARGAEVLRTKYSPDGTRARGTLNNCSHGVTPWNTYIAAEENWAGYFRNGDSSDGRPNLPREHAVYGVLTGRTRYGWELADSVDDQYLRFDASSRGASAIEDYRNEPNTFGWMVEIDPSRPDSIPLKHTSLGRFAHEGVVFAPAVEGRPVVCYSGDDTMFEHIYKFASAAPFARGTAGSHLLENGTLYVARFNDDGTGEWIALTHGQNGLTAENGFRDQADVLVNTRVAARHVQATRMDRPEWGAIEPGTGAVYFTLTNNAKRKAEETDKANPRAHNEFGHIIRWHEDNGDHAATRFRWDLFVLGGDAESGRDFSGKPLDGNNLFACPDGLWFDAAGRLWIETDIGESEQNKGVYKPFGNNAMLCADPANGEIRRFLTGPVGQEITGCVTTPDGKTMFINVQHPGATTTPDEFAEGRMRSRWPSSDSAVPRSATVVITRDDGGVIGT